VIGIEVNDIESDIFNLTAAVEWFPWDKVGFQLGYTVFDIEVDSGDSDLEGKKKDQTEDHRETPFALSTTRRVT